MKNTQHPRGRHVKVATRYAITAALALSIAPSVAIAEGVEAELNVGSSDSVSTQSEDNNVSSEEDYSATLLSESGGGSTSYDLSNIADGTYSATVTVVTDDPDNWSTYDLTVSVTVSGGKITSVTSDDSAWDDTSWEYIDKALNGNKKNEGMATKIIKANGTSVDTVSGATIASNAIKTAVDNALQAAYDKQNPSTEESEYTYGYVGLTWAEYWENEGVYDAGDTTSSSETDYKGEADKGAFDVVTRATTNHGLHRGSFQSIATIYDTDGHTYVVDHWSDDGATFYEPNGTAHTWSKGTIDGSCTMDHYEVSGTKYVPVAVKTSDLEAFAAAGYTLITNGSTLQGGYSEKNLNAYSVTSNVTADTYGLKTATKNDDGSFSFSARSTTGTDSGIQDQTLATASGITVTVKEASGSYGEFLRVDLTGDGYGALGASMQSVTWTYYGSDGTYTTALQTYGTKFAADNWMHKSMGIQLGLTDSVRCQLPEGYDGTGYWTITVHALGYEDYTAQIEVTSENIVDSGSLAASTTTIEALQAAYDEGMAIDSSEYTAASYQALADELAETKTDYLDKYAADKTSVTDAAAREQLEHVNNAIDGLVVYEGSYVYMNIPYDEFYAAELTNNSVDVDVFTSATKTKTRSGSLSGGSYHANSTGESILGITYAVKLGEGVTVDDLKAAGGTEITDSSSLEITTTNRGTTSTTTYTGKDALYEAASYSYYVTSEKPTNYKVVTKDAGGNLVFSAVKGDAAAEVTGITATFSTETTYGDYELDFDDELSTSLFGESGSGTVYAVVVNTTDEDGNAQSYGLRHLENIWRTVKLAWCTGFTDAVHNCPTSSDHYESMMGNTITSVTYYTSNGIYNVGVDDIKVPVKFDASAFAVEDAQLGDTTTGVTLPTFPDGYDPVYTIGETEVTVENGELTLPEGTTNGAYTLTVSDKNGTYASYTADFEVKVDANVTLDSDRASLVATDDTTDVAAYAKAITSVTIGDQTYNAAGRNSTPLFNEDGTVKTDATPFASMGYGDTVTMTISATGYNDKEVTYEKVGYLLMNIPYDDFYEAELTNNDVDVDGFTSATLNKSRSGSLAGGSYHVNSDGTDITGITYAVKIGKGVTLEEIAALGGDQITDDSSVDITVTNRGTTSTTTYTGSEALFEAKSYSYYLLSDAPTSYKELTINSDGTASFGKATGTVETKEATATLTTETTYGDYELDMDGSIEKTMFGTNESGEANDGTVYGVTINTTDGTGYGLRHIENIWRTTKLAWCTGFTTSVHNCPTSSEHYKSMMGKTIDSVTYYTSNGIYTFDIEDTYVPVLFDTSGAAVADAQKGDTSTAVTLPTGLPEDYQPVYTIEGWDEAVSINDSGTQLSIPTSQANGAYTLTVTDKNGKYASFSADFQIKANAAVEYDDSALALKTTDGSNIAAYTGEIKSVTVDGTSYSASGRNAKVVINEDGTLNVAGDVLAALANGAHTITVTADGYNDLTFTYAKRADKTALNALIASAQKLSSDDYTSASYAGLTKALESAQTVAADDTASDAAVADAKTALENALAALVKKASAESKSELAEEVNKAATLNQSSYTTASWSNYQSALSAATSVLANDEASEDEVNQALSNLENARAALATAQSSSTTTSTTANTTTNNTTTTSTTSSSKSGSKSLPQTGDGTPTFLAAMGGVGAALIAAAAALRRHFSK